VCFLLNHTFDKSINDIPLNQLKGKTIYIIVLLRFHFLVKLYHKSVGKSKFPLHSRDEVGNIVGISEHCGHALTWKILFADTNVFIFRSIVCPSTTAECNLCDEFLGGEKLDEIGS
jgi:hypothetical protein